MKKIKIAWSGLNYTTATGVLILHPSTPAIAPLQGMRATTRRKRPPSALSYPGSARACLPKSELGQYDAAVADYDETIRLKPDFAEVYLNRGAAKAELNLKDEARKDFKIALELAQNTGHAALQAKSEKLLRDLDNTGGS